MTLAIQEEVRQQYLALAAKVVDPERLSDLPKEKDRAEAAAAAQILRDSLVELQPAHDEVNDAEEKLAAARQTLKPVAEELTAFESQLKAVVGTTFWDLLALTACGFVPMLQTFLMLNFLIGFPTLPAGVTAFAIIFILYNYLGGGLREAYAREIEMEARLDIRNGALPQPSVIAPRRRLSNASRRSAGKVTVHPALKELRVNARWILLRLCVADMAISIGFPALTSSLIPNFEFTAFTVMLAGLSLGLNWVAAAVIREQVKGAKAALRRRIEAEEASDFANFDAQIAVLREKFIELRREVSRVKEVYDAKHAALDSIWRKINTSQATLSFYEGKIVAQHTKYRAAQKQAEHAKHLAEQKPARKVDQGLPERSSTSHRREGPTRSTRRRR